MAGELERLAYEAAQRGLDKQDEVLRDLRARTGTLLAAASIAVSLLGARALENGAASLLVGFALLAFAVTIMASVSVLVPRREQLVFRSHRRLAYQLDRYWDRNAAILDHLFGAYRVAAAGLIAEVLLVVGTATGILV